MIKKLFKNFSSIDMFIICNDFSYMLGCITRVAHFSSLSFNVKKEYRFIYKVLVLTTVFTKVPKPTYARAQWD